MIEVRIMRISYPVTRQEDAMHNRLPVSLETTLVLAMALLAFALAPGAVAQEAAVRLMPDPNQPAQTVAPLVSQGTDCTVAPSTQAFAGCAVTTDTQTLALVAFCFDVFTGAIIPNCNVQISVQARDGTGGHLHTDPDRPAGEFDPAAGNTGPSGLLNTTYKAPEVSGIMDVTITGTRSDGTPVAPGSATIGVELGGLGAIPGSGPGYTTTTSVGHDGANIFANPSTAANLQQVPVEFDALVFLLSALGIFTGPTPTLVFTSLSLPQGGLFDVDANGDGAIDNPWHPPHCGHRRGLEADLRIRNVPAELRPLLVMAISDNNLRLPVRSESPSNPNATHWHLRSR
jgi:hypothetical protein